MMTNYKERIRTAGGAVSTSVAKTVTKEVGPGVVPARFPSGIAVMKLTEGEGFPMPSVVVVVTVL